jgi:general nucleoside transport system permease protein
VNANATAAPGPTGQQPPSPLSKAFLGLGQRSVLRSILDIVVAVVVALALLTVFFLILGASPGKAFEGMWKGAFGNKIAFGQTLLVTAPLTFCALAAAIPFSARIFNIGGEGQLVAGAVGATAVAFWCSGLDGTLLIVLCLLAAMVAGALWSLLAGALKAFASANEVIVTLMLNFVAALVANYVINGAWRDPIAPQTETLPKGTDLPGILGNSGANIGVLIAIFAAIVCTVLLYRTRLGFGIRATGLSPTAARLSGFGTVATILAVFGIAGACAGLGGGVEVLGNHHALVEGIASNYGFTGIAVALVARLNPIFTAPVAFVFAAITVGANTLPATTGVSASASLIVVAVFVLTLLALHVIRVAYPEVK